MREGTDEVLYDVGSLRLRGVYRPCPECHHPMLFGVDCPAPGGVSVASNGATVFITPHAAGCANGMIQLNTKGNAGHDD